MHRILPILSILLLAFPAFSQTITSTTTLDNIQQVSRDGFAFPTNQFVWTMTEFNGEIYAGIGNWTDSESGLSAWFNGISADSKGGQILKYRPGNPNWLRVAESGLTSATNEGVRVLLEFQGALYAATQNPTDGCEIWKSTDGTTWTTVSSGGFGNTHNLAGVAMIEFGGELYVATENRTDGAEIWKSANGTSWSQVASAGVDNLRNVSISAMIEYGSKLYVGTTNYLEGFYLYTSIDGSAFTPVLSKGNSFDGEMGILDMEEFSGGLYLSTFNIRKGCSVFRSLDGTAFTQVAKEGISDEGNTFGLSLQVFGGRIYLGTLDRSPIYSTGTFDLYSSGDGTAWSAETTEGFEGIEGEISIRSMTTLQDTLLLGTGSVESNTRVFAAEAK
ncbi:hypothetical protein [Pontibacter sp. G13]|uniref:hypothetical protein n=1 Tax=Pontibacter sp. G13 TaxID=3074898 RepID=UPI00288A6566|nr:hypothetical protein [Pontibacter sp. G13]WNJ16117.1 hypothetical protein RJD25_14740 [Pontibacter sp. G13]